MYCGKVGRVIEHRVRFPRYPLDHKGDRKSQLENKYMKKWNELVLYGGGDGGEIEPGVRCPWYPLGHDGDEKKFNQKINTWKENEMI